MAVSVILARKVSPSPQLRSLDTRTTRKRWLAPRSSWSSWSSWSSTKVESDVSSATLTFCLDVHHMSCIHIHSSRFNLHPKSRGPLFILLYSFVEQSMRPPKTFFVHVIRYGQDSGLVVSYVVQTYTRLHPPLLGRHILVLRICSVECASVSACISFLLRQP